MQPQQHVLDSGASQDCVRVCMRVCEVCVHLHCDVNDNDAKDKSACVCLCVHVCEVCVHS